MKTAILGKLSAPGAPIVIMQLPLNLIDPPSPRLDFGVAGRNQAALTAMADLLAPGRPRHYATLVLWGAPGSGKTFWLRAWAHALGTRASWCSCAGDLDPERDQKIAHAIDAEATRLHESCETPAEPSTQACLLDDIDRAGPATVEALFRLYNAARESGCVVVASAQSAPLRLDLRDDLRTRLGQGLVYELHELNDEEKRAALRERAEHLTLPITDEFITYLLTHLPRDLGRLTALLDALNDYALAKQRQPTIPLLKEFLDQRHATARTL